MFSVVFASMLVGNHQSAPLSVPTFLLRDEALNPISGEILATKAPFIFFLDPSDRTTQSAIPTLNRLANSNLIQVVALVRAVPSDLPGIRRSLGAEFKIVADNNGVTIRRFGAERSLDFTFVTERSGQIVFPKTWPGLNNDHFVDALRTWTEYGGSAELGNLPRLGASLLRGKPLRLPYLAPDN
jgi:hypothetical protein